MITTNIPTLQIHKLTEEQYEAAKFAGTLDENALYMTPDEGSGGNIISITIPAGRMKGDIDGDGYITLADIYLIDGHMNGVPLTDEIQLLCADISGDGEITSRDKALVNAIEKGTKKVGSLSADITGNWLVNPNYETEEAQFYTDIPVDGMTASSSAIVTIKGTFDSGFFTKAECIDGAVRIYAKLCPIESIKAIVVFGAGDSSAVISTNNTTSTLNVTDDGNGNVTITLG